MTTPGLKVVGETTLEVEKVPHSGRLRKKRIRSQRVRPSHRCKVLCAGEHHYQKFTTRVMPPDAFQNVKALDVGKAKVKEHDRGERKLDPVRVSPFARQVQDRVAARRDLHNWICELCLAQRPLKQKHIIFGILYQQKRLSRARHHEPTSLREQTNVLRVANTATVLSEYSRRTIGRKTPRKGLPVRSFQQVGRGGVPRGARTDKCNRNRFPMGTPARLIKISKILGDATDL